MIFRFVLVFGCFVQVGMMNDEKAGYICFEKIRCINQESA